MRIGSFASAMQTELAKLGVNRAQVTELSFGSLVKEGLRFDLTREEVAHHGNPESAWVIIGHKVFDITGYLNEHPGLDVIHQYLGKDATTAFYAMPHSYLAIRALASHPGIKFLGYLKS